MMNSEFFQNLPLPELKWSKFITKQCRLDAIRGLEKVRQGRLSNSQYISRVKTSIAETHMVTDRIFQQKEQIGSSHVTHADLDSVDNQYLLCGMSDGGVAIYDVNSQTADGEIPIVGLVPGGRRGSHKNKVDCVQWYPADAGLFTTSCQDDRLKVWDPNRMKPVDQFKLDCKICHHHMSPVASKHSLIAAGGDSGDVILCDLRTGSCTHRLHGHQDAASVIQWAPRNQHILATGGRDQTIRFWDVRSSRGCLQLLDMDNASPEVVHMRKRRKILTVAHRSRVTSLCFTRDGLWLLSFGYDGELKLWNSSTGENAMIEFSEIYTELKNNVKMAVSYQTTPDLVYLPSKSRILVYELFSGKLVNVLNGHLMTVNGVVYNPRNYDLYSYGTDRNCLVWKPRLFVETQNIEEDEIEDIVPTKKAKGPTCDDWSSDED
ncbi:DNA excision repair protein ERCC-8-like [Oratosquilla oratoria]|uniref:DNA excision repair protein ERCC-8-like n=1 Tax=Oratosquilla oratoria TaxID=337810 RepID=UPI003F770D5A